MNQKLTFLSFYLLEKFCTIIFVIVFVPENCIFHTMKFYRLEVHKSSQVGKNYGNVDKGNLNKICFIVVELHVFSK